MPKAKKKKDQAEVFELSMIERFNLQSLLPSQARREHHYLLDDLRRELLPDADENEALGTTTKDGESVPSQFWAWSNVASKKIKICQTVLKMIKARLEELDKEAKLERWAVPLYDRFVLGEEPEPAEVQKKEEANDPKQQTVVH